MYYNLILLHLQRKDEHVNEKYQCSHFETTSCERELSSIEKLGQSRSDVANSETIARKFQVVSNIL